MYFRPATQEKDIDSDDDAAKMFSAEEMTEDDILYAQPTTFEGERGNTLLFVHQSIEQLSILKRYSTLKCTENIVLLSTNY